MRNEHIILVAKPVRKKPRGRGIDGRIILKCII
jgi:hypothetical protein